MFSLHLIHMHCYVTLKLLKKDKINPYLNGDGKLTSFHCKTALFYARGQLLSEMWTADRLFDCICDWTISGHFPHYIMDNVNLFDGKLNSEQRARLRTVLDIIIENHLAPLFFCKNRQSRSAPSEQCVHCGHPGHDAAQSHAPGDHGISRRIRQYWFC